jgi:arylsulfatase A-like enzyme
MVLVPSSAWVCVLGLGLLLGSGAAAAAVGASRLGTDTVDTGWALQRPHIFFVLQDDYGWNDFHGPALLPFHGNLTALAKEGIMLTNHLVHYHCSPTRRSFISGRLPIHHGEELSPTAADNVDLRWSLVSNKLHDAGYKTHWVGKGHVGFLSMAHLPTHRGFDTFTGFLSGGQSYTSGDRWHNEGPLNDTTYSSDLYGRTAVAIVEAHPDPAGATSPLFLYLPWQAVHSPYDNVPGFDCESSYPPYPGVYAGMLNEADIYMGQLRTTLRQRKMWENSLIVYCSDNGGVSENGLAGVNYPLRGEKHTNWAGGYRVAAFISGGVVPSALRGTTSNLRLHVVDWYPSFCAAAGLTSAQCSDDSPVKPLPVDPSDPAKDIYSNGAWPSLDGIDVRLLPAAGCCLLPAGAAS